MNLSRCLLTAIAVSLVSVCVGGTMPAMAGEIDKLRGSQTIRIAYRDDAPPFSLKQANNTEPSGYMINLCQRVAQKLAEQLGISSLKITYVPVTAQNRFDAIEKQDADLLCEATSVTLSRRAHVDFSIPTFIDGASVMLTDKSIREFKLLAGKKIGVLDGTTTETELRTALKTTGISADLVPVKSHADAVDLLQTGKITAYFADRSILLYLAQNSKDPKKLFIATEPMSIELYALALPRGDDDFRLAVDTALSRIYRTDEINGILTQSFGDKARPSDPVKALYAMWALPD